MKQTLLIDFDGTLCYDRFWRSSEPELLEKIQQHLFIPNKAMVHDWMKGNYTSEDINRMLAQMLNVDYDFLWNIFVKDCQHMRVEESTLQKINDLRNKYRIILITDNMDCFNRFTIPSLHLDRYFDLIINSYDERILKSENNGQLFKEVLARTGANVSSSFLIDNSEKLCAAFKELGGNSFLITKEKLLPYYLSVLDTH